MGGPAGRFQNYSRVLDALFRQLWIYCRHLRRSSLAVFHPIGEGRLLYLSPNSGNGRFDGHRLSNSPLGYFNLHGVDDGAEWYGQKDPFDGGDGPDFPVALKPSDLVDGTGKPEVVFTEACYGAISKTRRKKSRWR